MFTYFIRRRRVVRRRRKPVGVARYTARKEEARAFVVKTLDVYNAHYGFSIGRITIRNQRSRWGSCSKKGNLNFNFRIIELPEHLAEYIVVHELCHIGEFNHSGAFWDRVAETVPDWKTCRAELRGKYIS